jgi:hypothetical protein
MAVVSLGIFFFETACHQNISFSIFPHRALLFLNSSRTRRFDDRSRRGQALTSSGTEFSKYTP